MNRREFLRTAGGAAGAATTASAVSGSAVAQEGGGGGRPIDYGGYLEDANGWSSGGTKDKTGNKQVKIKVGPNSGNSFSPAAVHVDPGTKIIWEWKSSGHNVQAENGEFKSEIKGSGTYEYTADKKGVIPYFCQPHKGMGMKGALAVGSVPRKSAAAAQEVEPHEMGVPIQPHYVGIGAVLMMMSSLVFTFYLLKYGESAHTKGGNN